MKQVRRNLIRRLLLGTLVPGLLVGVSATAEPGTISAAEEVSPGRLAGIVRGETLEPVVSAHVYAYSLADLEVHKVLTDLGGRFQFNALPAGLYNIVAFKSGFIPAVVALTRPTADRDQALDLHLLREDLSEGTESEGYWQVRNRIPPDVLREIETLEILQAAVPYGASLDVPLSRFTGGLEASTGVDTISGIGDAQVAGGKVDFQGQLAHLDIGVQGDFWRLEPTSASPAGTSGTSQLLSLNLKSDNDSRFQLTSANNRLVTRESGMEVPVDFEHLRFSYSGPMGESGQSLLAAQVVEESNFYRRGLIDLVELPQATRTWELEGSYSRDIGDRNHIQTGLRYQQRQLDLVPATGSDPLYGQGRERMDLFGKGGYRARPAVLIEYGMYSVLRDGDLALAPQGGVVVQINSLWQSAVRMSGRVVDETQNLYRDFLPMLYDSRESAACEHGEELCYQVELSRQDGDDLLTLGAVHREFGETLRLYFSDDFFDHQESLYLVPGDRLPELQVALTRRLSPNVLTRLASSIAAGGGGVFYATGTDAYENEVRYFITSIDTQFRSTSTGVFVALHQLQQSLNPTSAGASAITPVTSQRLQLKVSQDLDVLLDLPAEWALHLNMELSRGNFVEEQEETRRRFLGGIAVKF